MARAAYARSYLSSSIAPKWRVKLQAKPSGLAHISQGARQDHHYCQYLLDQVSSTSSIELIICEKVVQADSPPLPGVTTAPPDIQRGFPRLPQPESEAHITLLKEWIHDCDINHKCAPKAPSNAWSPTRLLDVDEKRLECLPEERSSTKYVALSHLWGDEENQKPFCTYTDNVELFQRSLDFSKLPLMFKDAVAVTKALGLR